MIIKQPHWSLSSLQNSWQKQFEREWGLLCLTVWGDDDRESVQAGVRCGCSERVLSQEAERVGDPSCGLLSFTLKVGRSNLSENTSPDMLRDVSPRQFWIQSRWQWQWSFTAAQEMCCYLDKICVPLSTQHVSITVVDSVLDIGDTVMNPTSSLLPQKAQSQHSTLWWPQSHHKVYMSLSARPWLIHSITEFIGTNALTSISLHLLTFHMDIINPHSP